MDEHAEWRARIGAAADGELSLPEQAALARHLAGCAACAGAWASALEVRAAMARSAGAPGARTVPRRRLGRSARRIVVVLLIVGGVIAGWLARDWWGVAADVPVEDGRAAIVVP